MWVLGGILFVLILIAVLDSICPTGEIDDDE